MKHVCSAFVDSFYIQTRIITSKIWAEIELDDHLKHGILISY